MANEFHTLNGSCTSLVPRGPGYEGVSLANQVCATVGAVAGENFVDGNKFIELSYGYSYANTWKVRPLLLSIHPVVDIPSPESRHRRSLRHGIHNCLLILHRIQHLIDN
jgi:hypothetical protein